MFDAVPGNLPYLPHNCVPLPFTFIREPSRSILFNQTIRAHLDAYLTEFAVESSCR
jgi:hypothetical protein